ncbi:D111/G-patch domain-containing protein [Tieghemostelium lacteum]|uniref:Cap-specific mRNA (nucleoside-2'-O-)-methyltransferase 1 n=1 Tax=Tieghemostelium lacteum TaxID=361077 RepID=A0A151ZDH9_TIELA|nr:D111/G-patch domain-containing protein [Tieghemostelium lacteum]|eukprot:KYQ92013.1 D111/G-patch domain-containing protein [Tieghemostelium lacteum]
MSSPHCNSSSEDEEEIIEEEGNIVTPIKTQKTEDLNSSLGTPTSFPKTVPSLGGLTFDRSLLNNNTNSTNNGQQKRNKVNNSNEYEPSDEEILKTLSTPEDLKLINTEFQRGGNATSATGFGSKILQSMGYQAGEGLGIDKSGRVEPIAHTHPQGKGGVGAEVGLPDFYKKQKHDLSLEELAFPYRQEVEYIQSDGPDSFDLPEDLFSHLKLGEKGQEPPRGEYCPIEKIDELERHKSGLDNLDPNIFHHARRKSNPYESIKGAIFLNRAAVKMANLQALTNVLTPLAPVPEKTKEFIYFADVCAGPGGFTEYTYWMKTDGGKLINDYGKDLNDLVKGFGFTLKGDCDWNFNKFSKEIPHDNFDVSYGEDGTGDILKSENIRNFSERVSQGTNGKGLNFFMADGGVSTDGNQNKQEFLLQHLVLCQFLTMFETLGEKGHFICKIFDTFNSFTVGLLYLVFKSFGQFAIVKPYTSRPLNSERYVVAKNLKQYRPEKLIKYLHHINEKINSGHSVLEIINKCDVDPRFEEYISKTSKQICEKQIKAFEFFKKYVEDENLVQPDHEEIRKYCLTEWGLPQETSRAPFRNRGGFHNQNRHNPYGNRGNYNNVNNENGGYNNNNNNFQNNRGGYQNNRGNYQNNRGNYQRGRGNYQNNRGFHHNSGDSQNINQGKPRYNNNPRLPQNSNQHYPYNPQQQQHQQQQHYPYNPQQFQQYPYQQQQQLFNQVNNLPQEPSESPKKRPREEAPEAKPLPKIDATNPDILKAVASRKVVKEKQ